MSGLKVISCGPAVTVQDQGRAGLRAFGVQVGGALDQMALWEGAALLRQDAGFACLEMAGMGGVFEATAPVVIALTGAPMRASVDGASVQWQASHALPAGARLSIGGGSGLGYLHVAGGVQTPLLLGARAVQSTAGLGRRLAQGDVVPLRADAHAKPGFGLPSENRFEGGVVRVLEGPQTSFFADAQRAAFEATTFLRDMRSDRTAIRLDAQGTDLRAQGGLNIVSDVIIPGDIQITGDGTPFVLMRDCQTTGGYPRIATVIPCDMPRVAQAPIGAQLRFRFVSTAEALAAEAADIARKRALSLVATPLVRDPRDIPDLLSYQLVSGVISARD